MAIELARARRARRDPTSIATIVPETSSQPKIAVVGGGIIGLSVAWELGRRGADVFLYERGTLSCGATHVAAGMLAPVSEADPAERELLDLGLASAAAWPDFAARLEQEAGLDPGTLVRTDGTLLVARDADEGRWLGREAELRQGLGLECEVLTPTQARRLEPDLAPGLRGALSAPGDRSVDPRQIGDALQAAALHAGVALHVGHSLSGLDDQRLAEADRVVVCTGAWPFPGADPDAARTHPVKGQLLVLRDPDHDTRGGEPIVTRTIRAQTVYVVPRGDGRYVVGATMEHRGYDTTVTAWAIHDLLRELFEVVPAAREWVIEETIAGLRPATASGDPLIGPAPGDPAGADARVVYAVGHYRNGVLLAPETARRIADLLLG